MSDENAPKSPGATTGAGDSKISPERLRSARDKSLLAKWARAGRLSPTEFAEIRHLLPANAEIEETPGRTSCKKRLVDYVAVFGVKVRQLKKYRAIGEAAKDGDGNPKPDPPPFDEPGKMLAWWRKNMTQRPPARIVALAATSLQDGADVGEAADKIDFDKYKGQLSDALMESRTLLTVTVDGLKKAYELGIDAKIEIALRRFKGALRAVKETEQAVREDQKAAGDLIPKAEILPELSELLQVLKHMRGTRRRRALARLTECGFSSDELTLIGDAVDAAREDEDRVLRRAKHFGSLDEIDDFMLANENG